MSPEVPATSRTLPAAMQTRTITVAGHELTLFMESPPMVQALLADIRSARERVWVEVYIILNDAVGRAVADALKERARAGLDVRLLYDFIGSYTTPTTFFEDLAEAGVQVHAFHSVWEALWKFSPTRAGPTAAAHGTPRLVAALVAVRGGTGLVDAANSTRNGCGPRRGILRWVLRGQDVVTNYSRKYSGGGVIAADV